MQLTSLKKTFKNDNIITDQNGQLLNSGDFIVVFNKYTHKLYLLEYVSYLNHILCLFHTYADGSYHMTTLNMFYNMWLWSHGFKESQERLFTRGFKTLNETMVHQPDISEFSIQRLNQPWKFKSKTEEGWYKKCQRGILYRANWYTLPRLTHLNVIIFAGQYNLFDKTKQYGEICLSTNSHKEYLWKAHFN